MFKTLVVETDDRRSYARLAATIQSLDAAILSALTGADGFVEIESVRSSIVDWVIETCPHHADYKTAIASWLRALDAGDWPRWDGCVMPIPRHEPQPMPENPAIALLRTKFKSPSV